MNEPRVTIITVVYNNASALKITIDSVKEQKYINKEYVIVDGGSTDATLQVLKEHECDFSCCISEPDKGTYDAMNKALFLATGEWVIFMNAGDCFYHNCVLNQLLSSEIESDIAILGGNIMAYSNTGLRMSLEAKGKNISYKSAMPCSHQAALIRRNIHMSYLYDFVSYPICADYACMCSILEAGHKFQHVDIIVSWFNIDGISSRKCFRAMLESRRIPCVENRSFTSYFRAFLYEWKQRLLLWLPENIRVHLERRHLQKCGWVPMSNDDVAKLSML